MAATATPMIVLSDMIDFIYYFPSVYLVYYPPHLIIESLAGTLTDTITA